MRFLSVCSGIEAASVAWRPLGWSAAGFAEIDPFCSALLKHHYPDVPNYGDLHALANSSADVGPIDLLCGGTPCQSFSVAGLRGGLGDVRGNLALDYARLADRLKPRWLLWENVPGVLSSHGGRDFGSILGALVEIGYGVAYRVLDAQFYGVPQRRRRVFVVGYLGDWRRAAAVLFESKSLRWDPPPRRKTRQDATSAPRAGVESSSRVIHATNGDGPAHCPAAHYVKGGDPTTDNYVLAFDETQITSATNRSSVEPGRPSPTLSKTARPPTIAFHHTQDPISGPVSPALSASAYGMGVCITGTVTHTLRAEGFDASEDGSGRGQPIVPTTSTRVRRLTPRECERLQGFKDDYTLFPYRKKPAADGPRYRALGNSWAVPCAEWIGRRIQYVDSL